MNVAALSGTVGDPPNAYVVALTDITALKEHEASFRRQEHFYKSILDSLDEAIVVRDPEGGLLFSNARPWWQAVHTLPKDAESLAASVSKLEVIKEDGSLSIIRRAGDEFLTFITTPVRGQIARLKLEAGERQWVSINVAPLAADGER